MEQNSIKFKMKDGDIFSTGCPELEGRVGFPVGEGMAFFYSEGVRDYELHIANTSTGKIRRLATAEGRLLVEDREIDIGAIARACSHGLDNARSKAIRYCGIGRWSDFKRGLCALSWTLYPDGRYFADGDGFGDEDNAEERVYAVMDTDLNIVEPFRPVDDVRAYLKKIAAEYK